MSNVSGVIKSIQDIMRKDVGVDGDAQRISQLVWLFFLKILDDREDELELTEDDYQSPLPEKLRWRNWAKDSEGITGDELLNFVNNELFPTLKNELKVDGDDNKRALVIKNVFEDAYNYMKSGTLLRQVINKICEINFNASSDRHTFGSIYEQILKDLQSAGNAGEFYTPRAVTTFIVDRISPQLEETVLDPACGTGGFLTNVIEYKRNNFVKSPAEEEILQKTIFGVEKKAMPHMLCTTNMILHGIDVPINIKHDNTLARPLRDYGNADRVNVIVTNPPFGGMEEDGIENNFPSAFKTRETANLFMALIMHILKPEGRAAVVLPDGFLFGEGIQTRLKEKLLSEFNLHTIVRLPNGVFNPYTSIKTNILFFTKGKPTEHVWFYEHPYPEGIISYNKSKPMRFEEFEEEIKWWGTEENGFKERTENIHAWKVSAQEIIANNYNLDIKNPHVREQTIYDPNILIKNSVDLDSRLCDLKENLASSLFEGMNVENSKVIKEHFETLTGNLESLIMFKKTILKLAVRGRLVKQLQTDLTSDELIAEINLEKIRLENSGEIRKSDKTAAIVDGIFPYEIPQSWLWTSLSDVYYSISPSGKKLKTSETLETGSYPVVDQGKNLISGYSDDKNLLIEIPGPVIIFGDHTKEIKYIDFDFVPGADGTKILRPIKINEKYFYYYLFTLDIEDRGYSRHFKFLNNNLFALPPLGEQNRIVDKIEEVSAILDLLIKTSKESCHTKELLAKVLFNSILL